MIFIKRKELGRKLIFFELIYVLSIGMVSDLLEIHWISYGIDVVNMAVLVLFLTYRKFLTEVFRMRLQYVLYAVLLLCAAAWLTALLNTVPILLVLWSTRNALRFFPFFFAVILFWNEKATEVFSKILIWLQIPNTIIALIEFYLLDLRGDYLGGLFGFTKGCNVFLAAYFFIVVTLVVEKYLHGKLNFVVMGATCFASLIISAMAELKVSYVVIPLIIIASFVLNKPSLKTFVLAAVISVGMVVAVNLIVFFFPLWTDSFSSIKALISVGTKIGGGYNIPRFGAFSEINEIFFHNSIIRNLIGYGFGACEYSSYDFLTSDFYGRYGALNYRWFSHQMWFLQTGYLGIVCYAGFILTVFFWITKMKRRFGDAGGIGSYGQIMCGVMIVSFVYNSSLTMESGYFLFAALAIPFVYYKDFIFSRRKKEKQNTAIVSALQP